MSLSLIRKHVSATSLLPITSATISPARGMHERGRLGLGYFQQHSHGIHLVIWWLNLRQLYQGYPKGPDVGLVVVRTVFGSFAHDHLWGHPAESEVSGFVISAKLIWDCK